MTKKIDKITFPNGEIEIKTEQLESIQYFKFDSKSSIGDQLIKLKQLDFLMCEKFGEEYDIYCNYLPYGRADGIRFDIQIKNMFSKNVMFYAPHTKGTIYEEALTKTSLINYLYKGNAFNKNTLIIFPDEGAKDRFSQGIENKMLNYNCIVKKRNPENGDLDFPEQKIENAFRNILLRKLIPEEIKKIIIIDDIISKGGTMLAVESILRKQFPKAKIKGAVFYDENTKPKDYPLKIDIITEEIFK